MLKIREILKNNNFTVNTQLFNYQKHETLPRNKDYNDLTASIYMYYLRERRHLDSPLNHSKTNVHILENLKDSSSNFTLSIYRKMRNAARIKNQ